MCVFMSYSENISPYYKTLKILIRKREFTNLKGSFNILLCLSGLPSIFLEVVDPILEI